MYSCSTAVLLLTPGAVSFAANMLTRLRRATAFHLITKRLTTIFLVVLVSVVVPHARVCDGLAARGETPAAFGRRCIPADCVAPPSHMDDMLGRRALSAGRLAALDATLDFHHGLLRLQRSPWWFHHDARRGAVRIQLPVPIDDAPFGRGGA